MEKVSVYICTGCGIDKLDIERLKKVSQEEYGIEPVIHPHLCSKEGAEMIRNDEADGIVIAACSPRVKTNVFDIEGKYVERVNLREGVVWSHDIDEHAQELAEDYLRIGIVKAQKAQMPEPYIEETSKDILVVGGGVTGLTAALEIAKAGYKAYLVEKEPNLGGWLAKNYKALPTAPPYNRLEEPIVHRLIEEVTSNGNITVYTSSIIESISGQPGMFDVTISQNGKQIQFRVGAIVVATGWKPYDATKLENLGYGKFKDVVTNIEFEQMAKEGKIVRPSDGKEAKDVVFIQCAGQRDPDHLPYCSSVCCLVSLKQAKYVRELNDGHAFVIYKDMRTVGIWEDFYKEMQQDEGIFLTKGEVSSIYE